MLALIAPSQGRQVRAPGAGSSRDHEGLVGQDALPIQLPDDKAPPIPIGSCWLLWLPGQRGLEGVSAGQLAGIARGQAGLFKLLLGRRAMRLLRPRATLSDWEAEELVTLLFLQAEVPGKEEVALGPFMVNGGTGPLGMRGGSSIFSSWGAFSQPAHSQKPSFEGASSERSNVVLRSRAGRARGVEQFCTAEGPRGTRLLMTVAGQMRGEWQEEEAFPPLGVLGPSEG